MSDHPDLNVLDYLRAIRSDLSKIKIDLFEVRERLRLLESQYASISRRLDLQGDDVEQIKRRMEIAEA